MTGTPIYPDTLFLPPEAFEDFSKYLNIYGKDHVYDGEDFVRYVRVDIPNPALDPYLCSIIIRAHEAAEKAKCRYPQPNKVLLKVAEEAGEVVRAGAHYSEGRMKWSEVEAESVQAIAMIFRLLTEGDEINGVIPPHLKGQS